MRGPNVGEVLAIFLGASHRTVETANPVTRVAVPVVQAPFNETIDNEVADWAFAIPR